MMKIKKGSFERCMKEIHKKGWWLDLLADNYNGAKLMVIKACENNEDKEGKLTITSEWCLEAEGYAKAAYTCLWKIRKKMYDRKK